MEGPAQECGTGRPNAGAIPDAKRRQETPKDAKSVSKRVPFLFGSLSLSLLFECLQISNLFIFLDSVIQYQICD